MENLKITQCAKGNQYKGKRKATKNSNKNKIQWVCVCVCVITVSYLDLQYLHGHNNIHAVYFQFLEQTNKA